MEIEILHAFTLAFGAMFAGFIMLVYGGNWTIDGAAYVARHYGISPLVVGFTIIAFGTSFSELVVSVLANLQGSPGIAIGNVLGSNIANILMVVGLTAFFMPLMTKCKVVLKDITVMMLATILLVFLMVTGDLSRMGGALMIGVLILYIAFQYVMASKGKIPPPEQDDDAFPTAGKAMFFLLIGLGGIGLGGEFLVQGAKVSASLIGVPEAVIGLSLVAFGTSLPELSTSIIAARKGQSEMILGNIIGSNVFNILMIIGVTAMIKPITQGSFEQQLADFDVWLVLIVSVIFSALLLSGKTIGRFIGAMFFAGYIIYNVYIYAIHMM